MPLAAAAASTNFVDAIVSALKGAGMLSDQIIVLDPNSGATTPYDPETDEGGVETPLLVIGPRAAYVKALSADVVTESMLLQGKMRYRIQFEPQEGDPLIEEGMVIRVLPGGQNAALHQYAFAVLGSPTGSIAALTKVECQTNGRPSAPWVAP